jgi:hypothetical protein
LYSLVVVDYLESENDGCDSRPRFLKVPPHHVLHSNPLLTVNGVFALEGCNVLVYVPADLFSDGLPSLRQFRAELHSSRAKLATLKSHSGYRLDSEIDAARWQHIHKLHRYNEAKDLAQALLGKLAVVRGTTTRELYPEFDLLIDD